MRKSAIFCILIGTIILSMSYAGFAQDAAEKTETKETVSHEKKVALRVKEILLLVKQQIDKISSKLDEYLYMLAEKYNNISPAIESKRVRIIEKIEQFRDKLNMPERGRSDPAK